MHNVIVTGGTRGLGLEIGRRLSASGFRVTAIARSAPNADLGPGVGFLAWDLSDIASLSLLARRIRDEIGPVYGLVNNAGIGPASMLATMRDSDIARVMTLNMLSPITLTKYLARPMMAARAGRIVNIASIVATTGYAGLSVYSSTKAAMLGFTRSLARELGPLDITVNAVAPGFIDTEMTSEISERDRKVIMRRSALGRMAKPADVAAAVDFLFGSGAANLTGTVMTVDAGNTV